MKVFFRITLWVLISVILQVGALIYFDRLLHVEKSSNFIAEKVKVSTNKPRLEEIRIDSSDATNIKVSYDGAYASYITGDTLHILDMAKKNEVAFLSKPLQTISFYKWLPDRNRMLIIYKNEQRYRRTSFELSAYDVDNMTESPIQKFRRFPSDTEVSDLQLSTFTNMIYIHLHTKRGYSYIYRIDIMNRLRVIWPTVRYIDKIFEASHRDLLVYHGSTTNKYYLLKDGRRYGQLEIDETLSLLGIDKNDHIYAAEFNQTGDIVTIYKGKARSTIDSSKWKAIKLPKPTKPENIIFNYDRGIFVKTDNNELIRLSDNKKFKTNGSLIDILNDDFVFLNGNRLSVSSMDNSKL